MMKVEEMVRWGIGKRAQVQACSLGEWRRSRHDSNVQPKKDDLLTAND